MAERNEDTRSKNETVGRRQSSEREGRRPTGTPGKRERSEADETSRRRERAQFMRQLNRSRTLGMKG